MVFLAQCLGTRLLGRFLPKLEPRLRAGAFFICVSATFRISQSDGTAGMRAAQRAVYGKLPSSVSTRIAKCLTACMLHRTQIPFALAAYFAIYGKSLPSS